MDFTGLKLPSYAEIQQLDAGRLEGLPPLRVSILRNVVLDPIVPYLRYLALQDGFQMVCRFGEYDNVMQEAMGGAPELLGPDTDCVVLCVHLDQLSWDLGRNYAALDAAGIRAEVDRISGFIEEVLAGIRRQTPAMILWAGFEPPMAPALGILDGQSGSGQADVVYELNQVLRGALRRQQSAYFLDLGQCLGRIGAAAFYDLRYWHVARAPYSLEALRVLALEIAKYLRALKGKARKCLVLDCDGVVWGGTIGEDGMAGIKLAKTFPGSPYLEFQQEVLNLYHRGVVIALCSKNDEADVWEVFDKHPDMLLKRQHVAAARINWQDKAANLREIAAELNLGLDSLVFADDSQFEVDLVRQLVPEVTVLHLPSEKASESRYQLATCGLFETLTLSEEDRRRGAAYQAEAARRQLQTKSGDLASYLRSLEQMLEIRLADSFAVPRIAQLTQKTNQFNLTTRRYSAEDVARMMADDAFDVIHLRHRDRFGDSGLVGVCILRYDGPEATFDSLLLSCRVLGRGVEAAFLTQCLARARQRGARVGVGEYLPTSKNGQVREFYAQQGFSAQGDGADRQRYTIDLADASWPEPEFFHIESDLIRADARSAADS